MQLADVVLHQAPFYSVERLFVKLDTVSQQVSKPFTDLASLDSEKVQTAVVSLPTLLEKLVAEHSSIVAEVETAAKNHKKVMQAVAIVELITMLASLRIALPPRTPGPPLVSVGVVTASTGTGALVGSQLVISVEWVEMIRRLVAAGVIAAPVAAAGAQAGIMMMAAGSSGVPGVPTAANVVSGGTAPLIPGKSALGQYGIDRYGSYANRPNDKFAGHELLQNLWLEIKGFGRRLVGPASRDNPAIALTQAEHAEVGRQQYKLGLFDRDKLAKLSASEVIETNALAMKQAGIPDYIIETLKREALRHAATLKLPAGGVP